MTKTILITGASGFIGSYLAYKLLKRGHKVIGLTRNSNNVLNSRVKVITHLNQIDNIESIDGVINLRGAPINKRWTQSYKKILYKSRIKTTRKLVNWMRERKEKPDFFISASATGFYGSQGADSLTEKSGFTPSFTHDLCQSWEIAALEAEKINIRTCIVRFGVVLGKGDGALDILTTPFKFGLGGKIGDGSQYFSWIHLYDAVACIEFLINNPKCSGIYNITAPNPVTNDEFTQVMAKTLKRPAVFTTPSFLIKLLFGEMGVKLILEGQNVLPERIQKEGYSFRYPELEKALKVLLP